MLKFAVAALALLSAGPVLAQQNQQNAEASLTIRKGRVTHNVVQNGAKGLQIHHEVVAKGLKGEQLEVSCYFRYDNAGAEALVDANGKFNTPGGKVSVSSRETVKYDTSTFKDFKHFIPYDELHLGAGKTKIKLRCQAFRAGNLLGSSEWMRVTYTSGVPAAAKGTATFSKPRMVHNVMKAGVKGLELHHELRAQNVTGKPLEVTCFFYFKTSGKILKDFNGKFRTTAGQVSVSDTVQVKFPDSTFKDFTHFIPYDELHITDKGKSQLKTRCEAFVARKSIGIGPWQFLDFNK